MILEPLPDLQFAVVDRQVHSPAPGAAEAQSETHTLARRVFHLVGISAAEKIVACGACSDHLFQNMRTQRVAGFFRSIFGVKTFLQKIDRVAKAKTELRSHSFII